MFGILLKATNSSFQKGMTFCRSIYVKKVVKLLAFIFEAPSYIKVWIDRITSLTTELAALEHLKIYFHHFYSDLFNTCIKPGLS